jgi:hypothetical protein
MTTTLNPHAKEHDMSKFTYTRNGGVSDLGFESYDVTHAPSTKIIGQVARAVSGWTAFLPGSGVPDYGHRTRNAAAER